MPTTKTFRPYLIQRGKFKTMMSGDLNALKDLLDLAYMGSSEFEWGAIPKGLQSMCNSLDTKAIIPIEGLKHKDGRQMHLICNTELSDQLAQFVKAEVAGGYEYHLKESTYLDSVFLTDKKEMFYGLGQSVDFWWDIEHDWMLTLGKHPAELVVEVLNKIKARKGW